MRVTCKQMMAWCMEHHASISFVWSGVILHVNGRTFAKKTLRDAIETAQRSFGQKHLGWCYDSSNEEGTEETKAEEPEE